ncbi:MAG: flagellar basal body rod protein FlgC [Melioribacteraceae bacterium]|nr:flagellar basal body rod protein FlgC [Melioribacteraceae bacterium]
MTIKGNMPGFKISARGLSVQRKRMNLIAENIANAETTRTEAGQPYQRKFIVISQEQNGLRNNNSVEGNMKLNISNRSHFSNSSVTASNNNNSGTGLNYEIHEDIKEGELIFMPNHPDSDEQGYVKMSNVNIIEEMVEMIAASRSYEANLTALNASKQIAKDSLEI